jgi:PAS domain S-box-containing protein
MDTLGEKALQSKQIEQILQQITAIPKQAGDGIVLIDLAGAIRFANLAWVVLHGYSTAEELLGKHLSAFHTEEEMSTLVTAFMEEAEHRGQFAGPVEHLRSDGTVFSSQTRMTVTRGNEGEIVGLAVIATAQVPTKNPQEAYISQLEQYIAQSLAQARSEAQGRETKCTREIAAVKLNAEQTLARERARADEAIKQNVKTRNELEIVQTKFDSEQALAKERARADKATEQTFRIRTELEFAQVRFDAEQALAEERVRTDEAGRQGARVKDELERVLAQARSEAKAVQASYDQEIADLKARAKLAEAQLKQQIVKREQIEQNLGKQTNELKSGFVPLLIKMRKLNQELSLSCSKTGTSNEKAASKRTLGVRSDGQNTKKEEKNC